LRGLGEIRKYIEQHDAVVVGPGIGSHHETRELMQRLIPKLICPAIVDADGLNAFEGVSDLLRQRDGATDLVLTPHPGEYTRLTGSEILDNISEKIDNVLQAARDLSAVVVLKEVRRSLPIRREPVISIRQAIRGWRPVVREMFYPE